MSSETHGPWGPRDRDPPMAAPPDPAPPRKAGMLRPNALWWLLIGASLVLVLALMTAYPDRVSDAQAWGDLGWGVGALMLVGLSLSAARRPNLGQGLKYAAIWVGIAAVLAVGYLWWNSAVALAGLVFGRR